MRGTQRGVLRRRSRSARFAALRRSRSRSVRRFGRRRSRSRPARRFGAAFRFAALPLRPARRLRCGGFRRRQRLFVRPSARRISALRRSRSRPAFRFAAVFSVAALPLALGSPRCGGALARARFAAFVAALSLAPGSPLLLRCSRSRSASRFCCGALARARLAASGVRRSRSRSARRFGAAAVSGGGKGFLCGLAAALPLRSVRRFGAALSLRSVRRFAAALPLTLGSPRGGFPFCGALAHARFAALRHSRSARFAALRLRRSRSARFAASVRLSVLRRSRSRSVRRVAVEALSLRSVRRLGRRSRSARFAALGGAPAPLGSPLRGGAPARARFAALRRSRSARLTALRRSRSRPGGFYLINIYLNIIINQSRRRREAPAFRTAKKYAPFGGVFPLSDIYFCFAYSAIALYFSKSSGRRMRALAGLVEGSSMHGMQPQGSQNRL